MWSFIALSERSLALAQKRLDKAHRTKAKTEERIARFEEQVRNAKCFLSFVGEPAAKYRSDNSPVLNR